MRHLLQVAPWLVLALPATAQQDEWEWEADEGYHREEWYDPTDWFNEDQAVDYEYDAYDTYDTYDYDQSVYDDEWKWEYHYDHAANEWQYGWSYQPYADDVDYGWHYDDVSNDWSYGYHSDEYEYYTDDWWDF